LPAQRVLQFAEDKVVRLVDADLARALVEIPPLQITDRRRRPGRHLLVEQARRPATPVQRPAADRVGKAFERNGRFPGDPPDLVARRLRLRGVFVEKERREGVGEALDAGVLDMLRDGKEPGFDHQCAKPAADLLLSEPDMFGDRRAEGAAADNDHVERPASSRFPGIDLRDVIAKVAAFHVLGERRSFCNLRHVPLLLV